MAASGQVFVVVGGAGLVGSAVARALAADGASRVVVCDRLGPVSSGKWANLPARLDDLWAPDMLLAHLNTAWREIAGVLLFADAGGEVGDADALFETAWHLPRRVWDFASAKQRPVLWASTSQVYGGGPSELSRDPNVMAEFRPASAFGRAKLAFDLFAAARGTGPHAPPTAVGVRLSSVYGKEERHKGRDASLPSRALAQVRAGAPVALWQSTHAGMTDGGHSRDWVHADDVGAAVAALALGGAAGFFDAGTGALTKATDVARAAGRVAGAQVRIGYVSAPPDACIGAVPAARLDALDQAGVAVAFRDLDHGLKSL